MLAPEPTGSAMLLSSPVRRYALAIGAVSAAWLVRLALTAWAGEGLPLFITFYPAIVVAALFGGLGAGVLATALSATTVAYWLLPLISTALNPPHVDVVALAVFSFSSIFLTVLTSLYVRSRDKLQAYERNAALRAIREESGLELQRERALLTNVTATTDVMLVYLDLQFNFVWVNRAYAETCRFTQAEMVGKNHFALYPDSEVEEIFRSVRDTGNAVFFKDRPFEFPDQPERGVTYWDWSLSAARDFDGQVIGLVFSLRETTSFVLAERAERASSERYQRLFEHMKEGCAVHEIITDAEGAPCDYRFLDVNPAFEQLTGLKREGILGRRVSEVLPNIESVWIENYGRVALTGIPIHFEQYSDSLKRWYDVYAYQPSPGQFATVFTDVTQRKSDERELHAAVAKADHANHAKSRFLAAASHDLRQPLAALSIYASSLKSQVSEAGQLTLANLKECVGSLSELLNDLLDLSKLDAGVVVPNVASFELSGILTQLATIHAPEALLKGLQLRCRPSNWVVQTDPVLLRRLLGNLIENAIRYTERGGVLVGCRRHQEKMWLEVWDTGIGIPEDRIPEVFEEFKQLDDGARTRGSGLGLAIVARTAKLLGLEIRVRSREGKGSLFAIELPRGESRTFVPVDTLCNYTPQPLRIALAEDNQIVRKALVQGLQNAGHQVWAEASSMALQAALEGKRPDIVVSDYRLMGETGFEVIAALRSAFGQDLPALLITGDTDPALVRHMADRGIVVLHKPVDLETLQAYMEDATALG